MVNTYSAARLARVLRDYGEERFARRIADALVRERSRAPFTSTLRLGEIVRDSIPAPARRHGGHPAKRTFQALRIEVNGELDALGRALPAAMDAVAVGGRIVVLSYHSLEDRLVKNTFREHAADTTPPGLPVSLPGSRPQFRLLTRGAERPDADEVARQSARRIGPAPGRRADQGGRMSGHRMSECRAGECRAGECRAGECRASGQREGPGRRGAGQPTGRTGAGA